MVYKSMYKGRYGQYDHPSLRIDLMTSLTESEVSPQENNSIQIMTSDSEVGAVNKYDVKACFT
jgi:hypothetical protein